MRNCTSVSRPYDAAKAPGCDNVPAESYRGSVEVTKELFRICRHMWHTECIPPERMRGMFVMLHKKGPQDDYRNYRANCLLCHSNSYKLMSAIVARKRMTTLEGHLPDTQAGFRPGSGWVQVHRGTETDDYTGGPPTRYTGRVQAGFRFIVARKRMTTLEGHLPDTQAGFRFIVARKLMTTLEGHLPDTEAGFRPACGCRDVCAFRWFIRIILPESRQAVITFIDYSAAFNTESQMFLEEALAEAGVGAKVRRIVQAIFTAATGVVRLRQP